MKKNFLTVGLAAAAAAKLLQSCLTLCDPVDGSPPGSSIPGILQAGTMEWVAISFSNAWKWKVKVKSLGWVWLLGTTWTVAYQAPLSMGFSRQEYWSGSPLSSPTVGLRYMLSYLSCVWLFVTLWTVAHQVSSVHGILWARVLEWDMCPPSRDLPDPGIKLTSLMTPALAGGFLCFFFFLTTRATWEACITYNQPYLKQNLSKLNEDVGLIFFLSPFDKTDTSQLLLWSVDNPGSQNIYFLSILTLLWKEPMVLKLSKPCHNCLILKSSCISIKNQSFLLRLFLFQLV